MRHDLIAGDCLQVLPTLDADSIDAVVTDPPYDLTAGKKGGTGAASYDDETPYGRARAGGFMGREWDATGIAFRPETWAAMLRVLKPGGHLLAFGATRTYHRMAVAVEDAGFEIRDCLVWAYAEGFPKNLNVARRIDMQLCQQEGRHCMHKVPPADRRRPTDHVCAHTEQGDAHRHEGTALKPAWEPIIMARKPLIGTVADTVLRYGTGVLNIDATRLPVDPDDPVNDAVWTSQPSAFREGTAGFVTSNVAGDRLPTRPEGGRFPANVILTDPIFDGGTPGVIGGGDSDGGIAIRRNGNARADTVALGAGIGEWPVGTPDFGYGDRGTYSRFFILSKADRGQREPLLPSLPERRPPGWSSGPQNPGSFQSRPTPPRQNTHPTVKPLVLMQHLVRLVTPAGGTLLDPFLGSGTTAMAAEMEGLGWIGIEREPDYVAIAQARLMGIERGLGLDVDPPKPKPKRSNGRPWPGKRSPHGIMGSQWATSGQQQTAWEQEDGNEPEHGRDLPAGAGAGTEAG